MWFVLFNTEHFELMRRSSSSSSAEDSNILSSFTLSNSTTTTTTMMPNLTQTSLLSVLHSKANFSCSHTVSTLVTERLSHLSTEPSSHHSSHHHHHHQQQQQQQPYFTVLHYMPIFTKITNNYETTRSNNNNNSSNSNMRRNPSKYGNNRNSMDDSGAENANTNSNKQYELCMLMVLATREKQLRQFSNLTDGSMINSENTTGTATSIEGNANTAAAASTTSGKRNNTAICSTHAKHLANSVMYAVHGFINLIAGELNFEQVHMESQKYALRRKLNLIGNVIDGLLSIESFHNSPQSNISMNMKMQLLVGLPARHMCFSTKAATLLKQKAMNKLKYCAENYWNVADLAIYVNDSICVATDYWLSQSYQELTVLGLYLHLSAPATATDIPIHTVNGSRRLITVKLDDGVLLCILAGKTPSTQSVIQNITNEASEWNFVQQMQNLVCSRIQETIQTDINLLAFLYIDRGAKVQHPDDSSTVQQPYFIYEDLLPIRAHEQRAKMEQVLAEFYISISTTVFESHKFIYSDLTANGSSGDSGRGASEIRVNQAYMRTKSFGQCAIRRGMQEVYCIFNDIVPVYAYVGLANETLDKILRNIVN